MAIMSHREPLLVKNKDDQPPVTAFPRVIHSDEVPDLDAVDHFVFRDLADRARAIAQLAPAERRALADAGQLESRYPVSFEGLREGYERLAAQYEASGLPRKAARSYFRALVVATAREDDGAIATISEQIARLALATGDRPAAVSYLKGGIEFARRAGDEQRQRRLERQLRDLEPAE
jgi:hypothetical protein